tara:strand:+ start:1880 stop:2092 length:213 start_codon:yes stop_codon:yes gene_type:complete
LAILTTDLEFTSCSKSISILVKFESFFNSSIASSTFKDFSILKLTIEKSDPRICSVEILLSMNIGESISE